MAEVGIGILFAVWFIAMYLFVSRLRRRGGRSYEPVSLAPLDTSRLLDAPQRKRALTTGAMSEHHADDKQGRA
ncbi:MAG: hypothetical protein WCF57_14930 [Pyrinomonadaceae bacterium]